MTRTRRSIALTATGALAVAGLLAWALAGRRDEFAAALDAAPVWILALAAALQILALVSRSEAWHISVAAAGGTVSRRRLHRAAGTVGALCFAGWAALDRLRPSMPRLPAARLPDTSSLNAST